jgi:hypothetical protein
MPTAAIIIQQSGDGYNIPCSRDNLVLSLPVTVLNQSNSGVTSWLWSIVDRPTGSSATLVSPTSSTTTFTPDIDGTYLIKLILNSGAATNQVGAAVKTANYNYRIPAATETIEFDINRGWATAVDKAFQLIDNGYVPPSGAETLQETYIASNPASITLNTTNSTFEIHDASSTIGTNLFEVDAYGNGTKYLAINTISSTFTGELLQTGGKVGLGTITPGAGYTNLIPDLSVHIFKTGFNMLLVDTQTSNDDPGVVLYNSTGNNGAMFVDSSDGQKLKFAVGAVDSDTNRNTNTKVSILQSGAVGIGTTTPDSLLQVSGTGHFTGNLTLDTGFSSGANSSMGGFKIVSVATPTLGTDAVNKNYVDAAFADIIVPIVMNNSNLLLTTTSATNVVSYSPIVSGDFVVYIYYRVITAPTTITINVTWWDGSGSQSLTALATTLESVGSESVAPIYLTAVTGVPIVVTATAGTINQVYVSASTSSVNTSVNSGETPAVAEEANIFDYELTTTSPVNVLTYMPINNENFFVYVYYRVTVATTDVTIDLLFDDNSGSQTMTILTTSSRIVGSYSVSPVYIQAITSAPIVVQITAGTANQVYVSSTILMV